MSANGFIYWTWKRRYFSAVAGGKTIEN